MRAYERLLKYVSVYTTSDPDSATVPSSMRQYDLANILVDELKALGLENVHVDENGVVYGWLSATAVWPSTAASSAPLCSAAWPANGGACRCCPCST